MICPLIEMSFLIAPPGEIPLDTECMEGNCAWYNTVRGECLAQSLYEELRLLVGAAGLIADGVLPGSKPHEQ